MMTSDQKRDQPKESRWAGSLLTVFVLTAIGSAQGWLLLNDHYTSFLHPRFWPFLVLGSAIVTGFVAACLTTRLTVNVPFKMMLLRSTVMITPLVFMVMIIGNGMGAHALRNKGIGLQSDLLATLGDDMPAIAQDNLSGRKLSLLDIARQMRYLHGRPVVTEGMVYRDANVPQDHLLLFRFALFCCAADAIPVWVVVRKEAMAPFDNETWVKVEGTLEVTRIHEKDVPVIQADQITPMPKPSPGARYLYF
jgi:uncharacterized repeat protein (TIGR03943 family)